MAVCTAATSARGPVAQPIFQPVTENVLPAEEIVSVRSAIPGSVASGTCSRPSNDQVLVDLVGDGEHVALAAVRRRSAPAPRALNTLPVGLCGELSSTSRVRGENAAASASGSTA